MMNGETLTAAQPAGAAMPGETDLRQAIRLRLTQTQETLQAAPALSSSAKKFAPALMGGLIFLGGGPIGGGLDYLISSLGGFAIVAAMLVLAAAGFVFIFMDPEILKPIFGDGKYLLWQLFGTALLIVIGSALYTGWLAQTMTVTGEMFFSVLAGATMLAVFCVMALLVAIYLFKHADEAAKIMNSSLFRWFAAITGSLIGVHILWQLFPGFIAVALQVLIGLIIFGISGFFLFAMWKGVSSLPADTMRTVISVFLAVVSLAWIGALIFYALHDLNSIVEMLGITGQSAAPYSAPVATQPPAQQNPAAAPPTALPTDTPVPTLVPTLAATATAVATAAAASGGDASWGPGLLIFLVVMIMLLFRVLPGGNKNAAIIPPVAGLSLGAAGQPAAQLVSSLPPMAEWLLAATALGAGLAFWKRKPILTALLRWRLRPLLADALISGLSFVSREGAPLPEEMKAIEEALALIDRNSALVGQDPQLREIRQNLMLTLALAYSKVGAISRALDLLEKIEKTDPAADLAVEMLRTMLGRTGVIVFAASHSPDGGAEMTGLVTDSLAATAAAQDPLQHQVLPLRLAA